MHLAQFLFVLVVGAGAVWFICRRRVDPLAVGFGSALLYFMPGLFGWVSYPLEDGGGTYSEPIAPGTYFVMSIVLACIIVGSIVTVGRSSLRISLPCEKYIPATFLGIVLVGASVSTVTVGAYYFCDKNVMLERIDNWYYIAGYAVALCIATAIATRQMTIAAIAFVFILADFYIGFRGNAAIALIGTALVFGDHLLLGKRQAAKFIGLVGLGGVVLFLSPQIAYTLKYIASGACPASPQELATAAHASALEQVGSLGRYLATTSPYVNAIFHSEPFIIQSVLNRIVVENFVTDSGYLLHQLATAIPGAVSLFGLEVDPPSFNQLYQPHLFPNVPYGMANTPWGQAYAAGGYAMVSIFSLVFAMVLWMLNVLFTATRGALKGIVSIVTAWFAFYFHRNDLLAEVGIVKHVIYTSIGAVIIATLLWAIVILVGRRLGIRLVGP